MLSDEVKALSHESVYFKKLCWDQDRDSVLNVQLGPTILHDSRVGKGVLLLLCAVFVALLDLELPGGRDTVANCPLKLFLV